MDFRPALFRDGQPPVPTTRLPDDEVVRGRMHAERRQPSADQTSLPWRLSRSAINAADLAGAEFAPIMCLRACSMLVAAISTPNVQFCA